MPVCDILYLTRMQRSFFGAKVSAFIVVPPLVHRYGQCGHANQNERESGKVRIKRAMRTVHSFFCFVLCRNRAKYSARNVSHKDLLFHICGSWRRGRRLFSFCAVIA